MSFEMRILERLHLRRHREFGRASYEARQVAGQVIVWAIGDAPTPNYKVWLNAGPERSFPPVFEMWWMKPLGVQAEIQTPFSVHMTFEVGEQVVDNIRVRDADGLHEIPVVPLELVEVPSTEPPPNKPTNHANSFRLMLGKKIPVSYATTSYIGGAILSIGDTTFIGDELHVVESPLGQHVTVILRQIPDLEVVTFTLIVPLVLLSGHKPCSVELAGVTSTHHFTIAGPPLGQNVSYELALLPGIAEFIYA